MREICQRDERDMRERERDERERGEIEMREMRCVRDTLFMRER